MNDLYEARNSVYCYENSNVLKNKFEIKDEKKLEEIERRVVLIKLFELRQNNQIGKFDIKHIINIHKFLFEDIYYFAGLFRHENIAKGDFCFAEWRYIENELNKLLNKLKEENYLNGLNKQELAQKLAFYMAELNVLHPFREGNGRTIREFIRQIAYKCGYVFDIRHIEPKDMLNACIKSVIDTKDLENVILKCLKSL